MSTWIVRSRVPETVLLTVQFYYQLLPAMLERSDEGGRFYHHALGALIVTQSLRLLGKWELTT